jgi:hypothetical protein
MQNSVSNRFLGLRTRLSGWWNRAKYEPLASFDPQTGQPVLAGVPESANSCRTRHRRATILWSIYRSGGTCRVLRVRNVLVATGKRIEAIEPRRPGDSGDEWIWGRFKITADDVALIDDPAARPKYDPDSHPEATRLEKLLAKQLRFRAAVADPKFARVAFRMLSDLDWFNIEDREELAFFGSGSIAGMIAGVRDRGETYMDYKFGTNTGGIPQADVRRRVEDRIASWNSLTELEARAADSYEPTGGRYAEIPMLIYEGEEAWAEQLPQDTKLMMSKEYARRVRHLVATNRISYDEYRMLTGIPW